ncbi:MAG: hypothetical protein AAF581_19350 [Planctomycetota bacterium]
MRPSAARILMFVALAGILLTGCHKSRRHRHVEVVPEEIVYTVQPFNETFVDGFEWANDFSFATVDIVGLDVEGEFTVYIEDDDFVPVYEATFIGSGDQIVLQDLTDAGTPGLWYLEVSGVNLTSDLQVIVTPF